jgi:hypothetical protein
VTLLVEREALRLKTKQLCVGKTALPASSKRPSQDTTALCVEIGRRLVNKKTK